MRLPYFYTIILLLLGLSLLQPAWQFIRSEGISGEVSAYAVPLAFLPKDMAQLLGIPLPLAGGWRFIGVVVRLKSVNFPYCSL